MTCDYQFEVKILDDDGTTVLLDFNDHSLGLEVVKVSPMEETVREDQRAKALMVDGDNLRAWSYDSGVLQMLARSRGTNWGSQEAQWQVARAIYRARDSYKLLVVMDGASYLYRVDRPFSVLPGEIGSDEMGHKIQEYLVRWRAQPDYTVAVS